MFVLEEYVQITCGRILTDYHAQVPVEQGGTPLSAAAGGQEVAPNPDLFTRVFPKQLSQDCDAFNYSACRFHVSR